MDTRQFEEIQRLRKPLEQIASSAAMAMCKMLYELGHAYFQNGNMALSIATLTAASDGGDPFYSATALTLLAQTYRRVQDDAKEMEIYERIVDLPQNFKRFIDPVFLGIVYTRVGKLENARECYGYAHQLSPENLLIEENLAEVLILLGDLPEGLRLAEKLQARPEPRIFLVGRMVKGLGLYLLGQREHATEEFRWVAQYLISQGAVPNDFAWDFRDALKLWNGVDLRIARLVVQVLDRKISFEDFRRGWVEIEPRATGSSTGS